MNWISSHYLRYSGLGFSVMPVRHNSKKPALISWLPLQTMIAPDEILLQWAFEDPTGGIAIVCGLLSDLIVIDDDRGGRPPNREADEFCTALSTLSTAVARTKKGRHFYFRVPRNERGEKIPIGNSTGFLPGLDVRGEGGYVLAPPSPHPDGITYVWEREPETGILELPQWAYEAIKRAQPSAGGRKLFQSGKFGVPEGSRDDSGASLLGKWLADTKGDESQWLEVWTAFVGWNQVNTPPLPMADLEKIWNSIATRERAKYQPDRFSARTAVIEPPPVLTSAYEIGRKTIPAQDYAVRDFIADGVTQLFGKPKMGKSILFLQTSLAVATGTDLFPMSVSMWAYANHPNGFGTKQGDVLHLALEDSERRLQDRLRRIYPSGDLPRNLTIATHWPMGIDGLIEIENWLRNASAPRLVAIDTVAAFFGNVQAKGSAFRSEYMLFAPVWKLAQQYHVPIVLSDHGSKTRGKGGGDPFDSIAGTLGTQASVDTVIAMYRGDKKDDQTCLDIKSRDFEDHKFYIEHEKHEMLWKIAGPKPPDDSKIKHHTTDTKSAIHSLSEHRTRTRT